MGTTPNLLLPYPEITDPADVPKDIKALAVKLDGVAAAPPVTSLPGSPVDGQEVVYVADAAASILWHLRWRAASSRWEFLGGAPLYAMVLPQEGTTLATYAALATPGPILTIPRAGTYDVAVGARIVATANNAALMSYTVGATAASDDDAAEAGYGAGGAAASAMVVRRKAALAVGAVLTAQYKAVVAGASQSFSKRWMSVLPIFVTG